MRLTPYIRYFDKLPLRVLLTCLLAGSLWFSALAADDGGLPDTLVFKEGVELPDYAAGRELPCRVTSDDGQTLTVDVSRYKGVTMLKTIDKALIAEVRAAVGAKAVLDAKAALQKIAGKIKLPEDSQPTSYYDAIINDDIKPLAEKFPGSEISAPLTAARHALERERMLVAAGWSRLGGAWFTPAEAREYEAQRGLRALMADMKAALPEVRAGRCQKLGGLAGRVAQFKSNLYYPYLLDGAQSLAQRAPRNAVPPDLLLLLTARRNSANLLELAGKFQKIQARVVEIENLRLDGPGLYAPVINDLAQVSKDWPELEGLSETAERCADGMRRELWLAAARGDDGIGDAAHLPTRQVKMLTDNGALSLATAQRFLGETETALTFGRKLRALKKENRQGEIAALTLPAAAEENAGAREALAAQVATARTALATAGKELAAVRAAYDAENFSGAATQLAAVMQTCADHPEALAFRDQVTADFEQALKKSRNKRQRERLDGMWQVLRAGGSPRVDEFAADMNRERDFFAFFDNFSAALLLSITFGVALAFAALKYLGKLFADA